MSGSDCVASSSLTRLATALSLIREGAAHENGFTTWDPLGLADLGSPATLAFFRHAELKHCRVRIRHLC